MAAQGGNPGEKSLIQLQGDSLPAALLRSSRVAQFPLSRGINTDGALIQGKSTTVGVLLILHSQSEPGEAALEDLTVPPARQTGVRER